jgi:hypothetical protein
MEGLSMENLMNERRIQKLNIPQINSVNLDKLKRANIYGRKHKLLNTKKPRKEVRA